MAIGKTNTAILREDDGSVTVILHETPIVKIDANHVVTLNSGGYETNVTKNRMNQVAKEFNLNFQVFQKDHQWYVSVPGGDLEFHDGMTI